MKTFVLDAEFGEGLKGLPNVRCFVLYDVEAKTYEYFGKKDLFKLKGHEAFLAKNRLVAYYAIAELQSLKSLGIKPLGEIIDLFLIVKTEISKDKLNGYKLIDVCDYFKIPHISAVNKDYMRSLALRGSPYNEAEELSLLEYCKSDVEITYKLYEKIKHLICDSTISWGEYLKLCCEI